MSLTARPRLQVLVAAAMLLTLVVATAPSAAAAGGRIAGDDRYGTAVAISQRAFPDTASTVYLARAFVFADALSAGVLTDGPILLVPDGCEPLPTSVVAEIERLDPDEVVALGGEVAICDAQLEAAGAGRDTDRVEGPDRYATSVAVARRAFPGTPPRVYIASGGNAPDAVAGGALTDGPILLVPPGGGPVPQVVIDAVDDLDPDEVVALGGEGAVTETQLEAAAGGRDTDRLAGRDRFATAVEIATEAFGDRGIVPVVYLARGDVFADAVAAGSLTDGPVVLVPSCGELPDSVASLLGDLDPLQVIALGGPSAVCDDILDAAAAFATGEAGTLPYDGPSTEVSVAVDDPQSFAIDVPRGEWFSVTWQEPQEDRVIINAFLYDATGERVDFTQTVASASITLEGRAEAAERWYVVFERFAQRNSPPSVGDVTVSSHLPIDVEVDGDEADTGPGRTGTGQFLAFDAEAGARYDVTLTDLVLQGNRGCMFVTLRRPDGTQTTPESGQLLCFGEEKSVTFDTPMAGPWEVAFNPAGGSLRSTARLTAWEQTTTTIDGPVRRKPNDLPGRGLDVRVQVDEETLVTVWQHQDEFDAGATGELRDARGNDLANLIASDGETVRLQPGEYRLVLPDRGNQYGAEAGLTSYDLQETTIGSTVTSTSDGRRGTGLLLGFGGTNGQTVDIRVDWTNEAPTNSSPSARAELFRPSGNDLRSRTDVDGSGSGTILLDDVVLPDDGQYLLRVEGFEHAMTFEVTITDVG